MEVDARVRRKVRFHCDELRTGWKWILLYNHHHLMSSMQRARRPIRACMQGVKNCEIVRVVQRVVCGGRGTWERELDQGVPPASILLGYTASYR